jgi:hypothetical protein
VRRIAREHRTTEKPFDPERRGTWKGSSRDLVVNPARARRGDKHGRETDEEFLVIEDTDSNEAGWILINPLEYPQKRHAGIGERTQLYGLQFGAYGWTKVLVWSGSLDDALEEAAGWLADHAPGIFVDQENLAELEKEARKEAREENPKADDDELDEIVMDTAYTDLTYTESGYIPSYEWTIGFDSENQGTSSEFYKICWEASKEEYEAEYGEED